MWIMLCLYSLGGGFTQYEEMYKQSMEDPTSFWGSFANDFHWETKWDTTKSICQFNFDLRKGPVFVEVSENFIKFLIEVQRCLSQEYIHNLHYSSHVLCT